MFLYHTQQRSTWLQAARLLRSWVRIPPGAWTFVCCECHVLSGRGLCDELITRPEESYRLCCVVVCDLETSRMGAPYIYIYIYIYVISSLRVNIQMGREGRWRKRIIVITIKMAIMTTVMMMMLITAVPFFFLVLCEKSQIPHFIIPVRQCR